MERWLPAERHRVEPSDPDRDAVALVQVGSSTNNAAISTDGFNLWFVSSNNRNESFTYTVQDVRPYRPGDSIRTATGTITVKTLPEAPDFNAFHAIEVEWQSEAGKSYQVQTRLEDEVDWVNSGAPILGTGDKMSIFERTALVTKFYRVITVQ